MKGQRLVIRPKVKLRIKVLKVDAAFMEFLSLWHTKKTQLNDLSWARNSELGHSSLVRFRD